MREIISYSQNLVMENNGVNLQKLPGVVIYRKKVVRHGVINLTQFYFVKWMNYLTIGDEYLLTGMISSL